ncbi:MAG: AMP-binding protein [Bacteroidaceae bacterium]|nr:AMP-binding protein [Bacteroidaceae bacterium]
MRHRFSTLAEVLDYSASVNNSRMVSDYVDGGCSYTFTQFKDKCLQLSGVLSTFGINADDKVAILSENMPNWAVAFFAITASGRIAVPMLPELSPNEVENILTHSDAKAIFVSSKQLPKISQETLAKLHLVIDISTLDFIKAEDDRYTCDGRGKIPEPMDIAAIIYTSGTTGNAKGVMLSHRNFCHNILTAWHAHKVHRRKDVFLSILPLAHTYEMSIGMLYPFSTGCPVYYIQKPPTPTILADAIKRIRPTTILSVPLIIEKIIRGKIFPTIASSKYLRYLKKHFPRVLYFLVGNKVKQQFGGRVRFFGVGGSKLDKEVEQFLRNIKFPYAIGYGLTETAPLICDAGPKRTHLGTTGTASFEVQVRLADVNPENGQGELQVKGPNVMLGYYKDYQRTKAVFTDDGWMRTGDIATVDKKGRYSILGRSGSVIIGASGENIYPEEIESVINNISDVNESLVISRSGQLVALVQFNEGAVDWNLEGQEKFLENLEKRKKEVMEFVNSKVSHFLKIKDVEVMKEPFSKTATHKIRRFLYQDKQNKNNKTDNK